MSPVIQTQNLTKQFPKSPGWRNLFRRELDTPAVNQVTLTITKGEIFGLVGPNGAGKTTLIKMLATLILPTSGRAVVCGNELQADFQVRQDVGLVTSDERSFFWRLSGAENLTFFAALCGIPRSTIAITVSELLELVDLTAVAHKRFQTYSTGMRQRLSIARALLSKPKLLFLDEPTKGLDPKSTQDLHDLIRHRLTRQQGMTVFLTSHHLQEVESLCDRIAIMHASQIMACGTLDELQYFLPAATSETTLSEIFQYFTQSEAKAVLLRTDNIDDGQETVIKNNLRSRGGRLKEFFSVAWAFLVRDFHSEASYRLAFIFQFFSVFVSILAFYFVGKMFGTAATPYLKPYGGDYFAYVLLGIAFSGYFSVGLSGFSDRLRQAQTTGTLEAMLSTPTRLSTLVLSSAQWNYLMTTLRVFLYLLVGGLFLGVDLSQGNYAAAGLILILSIISFASLGIMATGIIMVVKRGNPITWIFGTTTTLLGGVYYPVTVMPDWLQKIANLIPVTYALRSMRLALLIGAPWADLWKDILVLGGFAVILLPLSLFAFQFAVRIARRDGSLTHY
jgi:ABC-2 type transport system permease protein